VAPAIPRGVGDQALVTLNVPNPYAEGSDFPGGAFSITVNGAALPEYASFTYSEQKPQSPGRMPTTLVVAVPLGNQLQEVQALWQGLRGSTVVIDSPASLSATI
jgi:mannose-binding lectin